MTTPLAQAMYELEHLNQWGGKPSVVFNPDDLPVEELPVIYGFNNAGLHAAMNLYIASQQPASETEQ